jgi:hypothetical protein
MDSKLLIIRKQALRNNHIQNLILKKNIQIFQINSRLIIIF